MDVDSSELDECCAKIAKRFRVPKVQGVRTVLRVVDERHVIAKRAMKLLGFGRERLKTRGAKDCLLGERFLLSDYDRADDLDTPEGSEAG